MKRAAVFVLCLAALALVLYPIVWLVSASLTPVEDLVSNLRALFPREFESTMLKDGDRIEIVQITAGG